MASRLRKGLAVEAARQLAPKVTQARAGAHPVVRARGAAPRDLRRGAAAARRRGGRGPACASSTGTSTRRCASLIQNHVAYAGVEGFATNLGGLVTAAVVAPANIAGLALIQSRMVAGIAHLRGYDLDDPRVRNAILETILGEDTVARMVKKHQPPAPPMAVATAPQHDPALDQTISTALANEPDRPGDRQAGRGHGRQAGPRHRRGGRPGRRRLGHLEGRPLRRQGACGPAPCGRRRAPCGRARSSPACCTVHSMVRIRRGVRARMSSRRASSSLTRSRSASA
ncbi:hypothetical protein [Nocardioides convexus]|uniref:hypothetical protein n=1 Tax=Nocardioides convexus TaxID=2712224 RepID=UPI0024185927|nr:hypothetical protein [Nocardioides convexus]